MYNQKLKYHFKPEKGWMNDPNGLVYFKDEYHIFYQHAPDFEQPWKQPMHWGHAVTKDFLTFEELPIAIAPDTEYDRMGCWSGTAIVKDGELWLFYASVRDGENGEKLQGVSAVRSKDGIHFEKLASNPLIGHYPPDGGPDFRDPPFAKLTANTTASWQAATPRAKRPAFFCTKAQTLFCGTTRA